MKTKVLTLSLCVVCCLALILGSCKSKENTKTPELPPPSEQTQLPASTSRPTPQVATPVVIPTATDTGVITIFGTLTGEDEMRFNIALKPFEDATGIDVVYSSASNFSDLLKLRIDAGDTPDISMLPDPAILKDLATIGAIKPLWAQIEKQIDANYSPAWKQMASLEGRVYAVPYRVNAHSLVWYSKTAFSSAGYSAPSTWQELETMTAQMAAQGISPWCIGLVTDSYYGSTPATEWLEDVFLHTVGIKQYDQWTAHQLSFQSNEVQTAFDNLGKIWLDPQMVYGGTSDMLSTSAPNALAMIFSNPPSCWLSRQTSALYHQLPATVKAEMENQAGFFVLPTTMQGTDTPLLVSGEMFVMLNDRAEVRKLMEFLATGNAGAEWAKLGGGLFPHKDLDKNAYPSETERALADLVINAQIVRYPASVFLPPETNQAFQKGMVDFVNGIDLAAILKSIDATYR
ncbi:MAG: carbohydrate ABC transporter substrate-binding protein [Anaerolineae bacterium]|nr:carbohydrate ABC transporter substrate-binding protein [Anaerolineae bacterium]